MQKMQELWVWSLGQEDPLEMEMATHSNILAWKIPWTEEPSGLLSMEFQKVGHDWALIQVHTSLHLPPWKWDDACGDLGPAPRPRPTTNTYRHCPVTLVLLVSSRHQGVFSKEEADVWQSRQSGSIRNSCQQVPRLQPWAKSGGTRLKCQGRTES